MTIDVETKKKIVRTTKLAVLADIIYTEIIAGAVIVSAAPWITRWVYGIALPKTEPQIDKVRFGIVAVVIALFVWLGVWLTLTMSKKISKNFDKIENNIKEQR